MPVPVMAMVMEGHGPPAAGRSALDRAKVTITFKNEKITKTCVCSFTFVVDGSKVVSSKATCSKKCNIKKPIKETLKDKLGSVSFSIKVVKGKATISKATFKPETTEPKPTKRPKPTKGPTGTGGIRMEDYCVCVYDMPEMPEGQTGRPTAATGGPTAATGGPTVAT